MFFVGAQKEFCVLVYFTWKKSQISGDLQMSSVNTHNYM